MRRLVAGNRCRRCPLSRSILGSAGDILLGGQSSTFAC